MAGCKDPVDFVAVEALRAITVCFRSISGDNRDITLFTSIILPLLGIFERSLANGEEELVISGLQSLQSMFDCDHPSMIENIEEIAKFLLTLLLDQNTDQSVKEATKDTFITLIEKQKRQFGKKEFVEPILSILTDRIAEERGSVLPNEMLIDQTLQFCLQLFEEMSSTISTKVCDDIVFEMTKEAILSNDSNRRKAGYVILGSVADGLTNVMLNKIEIIVPLLTQGMNDLKLHIRESASFALAKLSELSLPQASLYHHLIIPAAMKGLNDKGISVQIQCCHIIEHYCEALQPKALKHYLPALMGRLSQLTQTKPISIQEEALAAISELSLAAEEEFLPYIENTMALLEPLLFDYENESIWSTALNCIGFIAEGIGAQLFKPSYYELGMRAVIEGLKTEKPKVLKGGFYYIANIAKVKGKDFEPAMKMVMPYILKVLKEREPITGTPHSDEEDEMEVEDEEDGYEEDGDDHDDDEREHKEEDKEKNEDNKTNPTIFPKVSAIIAIGALAEHTKASFLPYLDQVLEIFTSEEYGVLLSDNPKIRSTAISVIHYFIDAVCDGTNVPIPALYERLDLPNQAMKVTSFLLKECLLLYDASIDVISSQLTTIGFIFERLGIVVMDLHITGHFHQGNHRKNKVFSTLLSEYLLAFLKQRRSNVSPPNTEEGEKEEEKVVDYIMNDICKLFITLAKIFDNSSFIIFFDQFHSLLLHYINFRITRNWILHCYSKIIKIIGPLSMKYADSILSLLPLIFIDIHHFKADAIDCIDALIEVKGELLIPLFPRFLQWLLPICVREENDVIDVDHTLSVIAKMIDISYQTIPLDLVLPVMLTALPIRNEFDETPSVFKALLRLVQNNEATMMGMAKELVPLLVDSLEPGSGLPDAARDCVGKTLALLAAHPESLGFVRFFLSTISDEEHFRILRSELSKSGIVWEDRKY